jgi:hypothetical protein
MQRLAVKAVQIALEQAGIRLLNKVPGGRIVVRFAASKVSRKVYSLRLKIINGRSFDFAKRSQFWGQPTIGVTAG